MENFVNSVLDTIAGVGAIIGGIMVLWAITLPAPQSASSAAIGIGFAVIPYCISAMSRRQQILKAIRDRRP